MAALMQLPETLEDLKAEGDANFPHGVLVGCETALCVFSAAFLGQQDVVWVADAGLRATVVDQDKPKLDYMATLYPADWEWVVGDAYVFAQASEGQWDVLTLDPWSNQFQRCADMLDKWCRLARHAVILGTGVGTSVRPPDGWRATDRRKRSDYAGGVWWDVLERA